MAARAATTGGCSWNSAGGRVRTRTRAWIGEVLVERAELGADEEALVDDRPARQRDDVQVLEQRSWRAAASIARRASRSRASNVSDRRARVPGPTTSCSMAGTLASAVGPRTDGSTGTLRQPSGRSPSARSVSSIARRAMRRARPAAGRNNMPTAISGPRASASCSPTSSRIRSRRPASGSVMPAPSPVFASAAIAPRWVSRESASSASGRIRRDGPACDSATKPTPHASWSNRGSYRGARRARQVGARRARGARRAGDRCRIRSPASRAEACVVSVPGSRTPSTRGAHGDAAWAASVRGSARRVSDAPVTLRLQFGTRPAPARGAGEPPRGPRGRATARFRRPRRRWRAHHRCSPRPGARPEPRVRCERPGALVVAGGERRREHVVRKCVQRGAPRRSASPTRLPTMWCAARNGTPRRTSESATAVAVM